MLAAVVAGLVVTACSGPDAAPTVATVQQRLSDQGLACPDMRIEQFDGVSAGWAVSCETFLIYGCTRPESGESLMRTSCQEPRDVGVARAGEVFALAAPARIDRLAGVIGGEVVDLDAVCP
ncbi:MAG: hypothetical protein U0R65_04510 [Candidatus Nanopelagicales bacterium]|jgi:hypothetical protein